MKEADPDFSLTSVHLFHPAFGRIRLRKTATETSGVEIGMLYGDVSVATRRGAGTDRRDRGVRHDRNIHPFDYLSNAIWVGNWVGCFPTRCLQVTESFGAPGVIRTPDLLVRSQTLYPTELRAQKTSISQRYKPALSDPPDRRERLGHECSTPVSSADCSASPK